ncbi:imelysin family protein [Chenggangzhangella methanolivorans]|uniref:Imelysin family protein n=2 Tax=Chenggangzhangella methanolivorans TaxID=1437009 RepID=A0A9E6UJX4_9HYPH|nr:imelysin family protein [Chenggangzhangella methanolivorans]
MARSLAATLALLAPAGPALAKTPEPGPLAVKAIETVIVPRYEAFAKATAAQTDAWTKACADGDFAPDLGALREAYQTAADGWAAVEFVTTGPIATSLRPDRVFFGPDRRNTVAKALAELTAKARDGDLSPETVRGVSVAAQGFPALERVLYEPAEGEAAARCRVGVAIAKNLSGIAADVVTEWKAETGPLARLKRGEGDPLSFADPAQAAARLMTDLAGGVQRVNDVKLLPVLGSSADAARAKAAEGWRSGRSARAIRVTMASVADLARVFAAAAPVDLAAADAKAFAAAQASAAKLPDDLGEAATEPKRRKAIEAAVASFKAAQTDVVQKLAPALGVPLGFNALDGD